MNICGCKPVPNRNPGGLDAVKILSDFGSQRTSTGEVREELLLNILSLNLELNFQSHLVDEIRLAAEVHRGTALVSELELPALNFLECRLTGAVSPGSLFVFLDGDLTNRRGIIAMGL